jgi:hypothetical protein
MEISAPGFFERLLRWYSLSDKSRRIVTTFSSTVEETFHRALKLASERHHEYPTPEHLLLALVSDPDAIAVLEACRVDLGKLTRSLTVYLDEELKNLIADGNAEPKPTAAFQRVIQRAVIHVESSGREEVTGANVLVAIFAERESYAKSFLEAQGMTRYDAVNYVSHGIAKQLPTPASRVQQAFVLSEENDRALEEWVCAVLSSAQYSPKLIRNLIRAGSHIPSVLSGLSGGPPFIALLTPSFRRSPLYDVIARESVFSSVVAARPIIPLVVGPAIRTRPFGELGQVLLSGKPADAICAQLFSSLDYSGGYETHADLLNAALRGRDAQGNQSEQVEQNKREAPKDKKAPSEVRLEEPVPEPGPEFDITSQGLSLKTPHPPQGPFDEQTQRALYERLKKSAPLLAQSSRGSNNPAIVGLSAVTAEYADLVARPFESLDVVSLWAVGTGLLANRDAFARAHDERTMTEPLEPAHFALLQQVAEIHGGFILGFSEARELTERADQARISGEAMERVVSLARGLIDQLRSSKEVDARTRSFLAAIEEGLVVPGWKITRAGFAAYVVTRNALIAIGRLLNWANTSFATVVGGIVLNHVDPGLVHTQFWIEFALKNSQQILAFAEPFPELKIWLNAQIDAAKADREMRNANS